MPKHHKSTVEVAGEVMYTNELGHSLVIDRTLHTLVEGKVSSLAVARALGAKTVPEPRDGDAVVFVTFFDLSLRILSVVLVAGVLRLYGVELVKLTPNSIVRLGIFEWTLRARGAKGTSPLFTYLHGSRCQPK